MIYVINLSGLLIDQIDHARLFALLLMHHFLHCNGHHGAVFGLELSRERLKVAEEEVSAPTYWLNPFCFSWLSSLR